MDIRSECWRVTPLACPRPFRHCRSCGDTRPFVCAETFRINAQKKVIDVWLNYRCERCDELWKCPVLERHPVSAVPANRLEAFFRDDPLVARRCAFDMNRLARYAERIEASPAVTVRRVPAASDGHLAPLCIRLDVPLPCAVRLDRLLAGELGVSRSALQTLSEGGRLRVAPAHRKVLRAHICDGQRVWLWHPVVG